MRRQAPSAGNAGDRPILPWKFVAGAFLHFIVPAYLLTILVVWLLTRPAGGAVEALLAVAIRTSLPFLGLYGAAALLGSLAARSLDPLLRRRRRIREARDPAASARNAARQVRAAAAEARRTLGDAAATLADAIEGAAWDHDAAPYQALARDFAGVVHSSTRALASAPPERRAELGALAATSLAHIATALHELDGERARLDEGDARTVARFVGLRYGPSDFAGGQDR